MWTRSKLLSWGLLLIVSATGSADVNASPKLPAQAKTLKEVVVLLEMDGYKIVEGSFDNGRWELEGYREKASFEIWVDAGTGKVTSTARDDTNPLPPTGAKSLPKILEDVVHQGYSSITSAEFDHDHWEIEAYHDLAKRELHVDAMTGKVLSDKAD